MATDWEIGNELMHRVCDELADRSKDMQARHPDMAEACSVMRGLLGKFVNELMEPTSMCPESDNVRADLLKLQELYERNPKWVRG